MQSFQSHLHVLPGAQQRLWPELAEIPKHFVLYGGTALALRLGHRSSVDFDFFSSEPFTPEGLLKSIRPLHGSKILQNVSQTLTVSLERGGDVKLSFFGALPLGRVGDPQMTADRVVNVASLFDLAGMKAAVITQRAESKDYLDLLALLEHGVSLSQAMAAATSIYGRQYNPAMTLKSLTYFGDGDLHKLTSKQQNHLIQIASNTDLSFPPMPRIADTLS
jgi:hypothetical protein